MLKQLKNNGGQRSRGFTLVELLVSSASSPCLIAILLPRCNALKKAPML